MIYDNNFVSLIDSKILPLLKFIVKLGNVAVHTNANIKREEAILALHNLHQFVSWIDYCYADEFTIDESHRSIYRKYKAIFDYFDSYLMGLTATPKDELDKNTYGIFDLESGAPTYAYELDKAVEDGYLVHYRTIEFKSKIMEEDIKYDQLSEEEKEHYEETFDDDENVGEEIESSAINEWLFNANTIDLVLNNLMEKGLKVEGGDKLGTPADYEKEFGAMPINKLVRKIVGLDRQAANEAFSEFLNNENLNLKQIHFVKLIVDYVVTNGFIEDNRVLQEDPFRTVGSIVELFKDKMDDARRIMSIVADIKRNSEEVV